MSAEPYVEHGNMQRDPRDEWADDVPVGTFDIEPTKLAEYPGATARILFVCPNDKRCAVLLGPRQVSRPAEGKLCIWAWDGNTDRPTITPSINCRAVDDDGKPTGGCGWHGHITNGVIG
jgi:hypothetical protein